MARYRFPDLLGVPLESTPEGIVSLGDDLSPETLVDAYRHGIFPWPITLPDGSCTGEGAVPLTWFSPDPRAILEFSALHLPRSLKKAMSRSTYRTSIDQAFDQVIEACSEVPRQGQSGTWITRPMLKAYRELHRRGIAHSAEVWDGARLIGGVYGVEVDGAFGGESMFHREDNASKFALISLVEHLSSRGLKWMDIQTMTPHLETLGAKTISRDEFLVKLTGTRALGLKLF